MTNPTGDPYGVRGGARTTQRRGRMSDNKRATLAAHGPRWLLDPDEPWTAAALDRAFGRQAPRLLDIGAGTGEATRRWAAAHPDHDVVSVELHRPGIARVVGDLAADGPPNVRLVEADATRLLEGAEPGCFTGVRVLFPDPWPKRRHVGRRLVDVTFLGWVADLLPAGGTLQLATDWLDYADQMRSSLAAEPRLRPVVDDPGEVAVDEEGVPLPGVARRWRSHRPSRPVTAYEQRGIDAGRTITDLLARRAD